MKIYTNIEQGTTEWLKLRLGKITGTRTKDVMGKNQQKIIDELIAEIVSECIPDEMFVNASMQRGIDMEPLARAAYIEATGLNVEQVGFCVHNSLPWLGLSPDGLIKEDKKYVRALEIKSPNTSTHVRYIRENIIPPEYKWQIIQYFLVGQDIQVLDFVSFDNRFSIKPLLIITVTREQLKDEIAYAKGMLLAFWEKFEKCYNEITF